MSICPVPMAASSKCGERTTILANSAGSTRPHVTCPCSMALPLTPVSDYGMDVRSIEDVAPEIEHNGTVPVWWLVRPREMKEITDGGYLELANEFEVAGGGAVFPHTHPTHEFYYVTSDRKSVV